MNTIFKQVRMVIASAVLLASCSSDKHPDYVRMEGKWKEVKATTDGVAEPKHDTWYEFDDEQRFESHAGKGYKYELDTAKHVMKALGTATPESGVNKREFEVVMFEKNYRFNGDTLVLGMLSKMNGKQVETYYLKEKE